MPGPLAGGLVDQLLSLLVVVPLLAVPFVGAQVSLYCAMTEKEKVPYRGTHF